MLFIDCLFFIFLIFWSIIWSFLSWKNRPKNRSFSNIKPKYLSQEIIVFSLLISFIPIELSKLIQIRNLICMHLDSIWWPNIIKRVIYIRLSFIFLLHKLELLIKLVSHRCSYPLKLLRSILNEFLPSKLPKILT